MQRNARRSQACAYLADDDHGPLALQEILLAGCPTVGVRTGASFVRTWETGVVVDRLPTGRQCADSDDDVRALVLYLEAIHHAQSMDRHSVLDRVAEEFGTDRILDSNINAVNMADSDSWDTCDQLAPILDRRFEEWRSSRK